MSDETKCVVRVSTGWWSNHSGLHCRKSIRLLRKLCGPNPILKLELDAVGADLTQDRIINLHDNKDGVYQVVTVNEKKDWETGFVDDYDLQLVPYEGAKV